MNRVEERGGRAGWKSGVEERDGRVGRKSGVEKRDGRAGYWTTSAKKQSLSFGNSVRDFLMDSNSTTTYITDK